MAKTETEIRCANEIVEIAITSYKMTDNKVSNQPLSKKGSVIKDSPDEAINNEYNEFEKANEIIESLLNRFVGNHLFILISLYRIGAFVETNNELCCIYLKLLFKCNPSIKQFLLYGKDLDLIMLDLLDSSEYAGFHEEHEFVEKNKALLFKAYVELVN